MEGHILRGKYNLIVIVVLSVLTSENWNGVGDIFAQICLVAQCYCRAVIDAGRLSSVDISLAVL